MTWRVAALMLWLQAAGSVATAAQVLTLAPSFGTSVVFDDNVFQRPAAESDVSLRFSPRLDVVRKSEKLTVSGWLGLTAERFSRHPELTTARAREDAALDARYAATPRLSIGAAGSFVETETPSELNGIAALTPGRARARRTAVHASATYSLRPRAGASVGYSETSDTLEGGVSVTIRTATSSLERHVSARSRLGVEYVEQRFVFGAGPASASRAITAEWTRELTRDATLTLRAGPRVTDGVVAPELAVTARRVNRRGSLALSYQRTHTTLIGIGGVADVSGVTAAAEGEARPHVRLMVTSGVLRTRHADGSSLTYRLSGACAWTLTHGVALEAAYDADRQRGDFYAAQPGQDIGRNRVSLRLVVARQPGGEAGR
jgi:hypothetical protein